MIYFKDTSRFAPVVSGDDLPWEADLFFHNVKDIPSNESKREEYLREENVFIDTSWWEKQKIRCMEGYTVEDALGFKETADGYIEGIDYIIENGIVKMPNLGIEIDKNIVTITGRNYFYLNFWKIRGLDRKIGRKGIISPRFLDIDFDYWWIRERMIREQKDVFNQKSRQKGYSEKMACDGGYEYTFYKASQVVIVSGEEKYAVNTMRMTKRGLDALINTQFYKQRTRGGDSLDYIKSKYTESEIYCRTAKDNPEAVSSLSPSLIIYEETGIWKKGLLRETKEFVDASLTAEGVKTGYAIFLGTGGDQDKGVEDAQKMFYNPTENGLLTFHQKFKDDDTGDDETCYFIPADRFKLIDDDGNSLRQESKKVLLEERKNTPKDKLYRKVTQLPLSPDESFLITSGGYFGEDVVLRLNERKAEILKHKDQQVGEYGNIYWNKPGHPEEGAYFKPGPDEKGKEWFFITQRPEEVDGEVPEGLYKVGTDSYDRTEANTSTSMGSVHVFKSFLNVNSTSYHWVARCIARPTEEEGGEDKFYELSALLTVYYNGINLIEYSNLKIFAWYDQNGLSRYLKERPSFVLSNWIVNSQVNNRYGIDPNTKHFWLSYLKQYLIRDNYAAIDKMFDVEQIEAFIKFRYNPNKKFNCDVTISSSLTIVLAEDEKEMMVEEEQTTNIGKGFFSYTINNGIIKNQVI